VHAIVDTVQGDERGFIGFAFLMAVAAAVVVLTSKRSEPISAH
jgi:hypothetical protein